MSNNKKYSIGCDIGGSHISCTIVDLDSGNIEEGSAVSIKVDNSSETDVILSAWTKAITECLSHLKEGDEFIGVGLAIPGPFDYEKGIGLYDNSNQKFVHLKDVNVKTLLSESLDIPASKIKFTNDADAFALGSFWYGSGKDFQKVVAITLGTGFGSSFVDHGKAIQEGNTVPDKGCLWHVPYKEGIADDYFSTRWFVNSFNENDGTHETVTGVKRIAELANEGHEAAMALFKEFGTNLGDCLGPHLKNFGAEVVIMGGNIAEAFNLFRNSLYDKLQAQGIQVEFKPSKLKETAAMLGAVTAFK